MRPSAGALLLLMGCAARPGSKLAAPAPARTVEVPRIVVTPHDTATLAELFAHARAAAEAGDFSRAAAEFDRIVALEPHGTLAGEALFLAGEARGLLGDQAGRTVHCRCFAEQLHLLGDDATIRLSEPK